MTYHLALCLRIKDAYQMESIQLDQKLVEEIVQCLRIAAGEIEHTISLLDGKLSEEDYKTYKRKVGKIIIDIHCGLGDSLLARVENVAWAKECSERSLSR